jgi:hypothetical protein
MKSEIIYFEKAGEDNTNETLTLARERFDDGGIDVVIVASSTGKTALKAADVFSGSGAKLIIVGEVLDGMQSPNAQVCKTLAEKGLIVIWGTTMGGMSKFTRNDTGNLVADTYKRISEGFKVVCEIVLMATSAGYIEEGAKVLSIAGTHVGSDTAVVAKAAPFGKFKSFQVHEILCKPYARS